ncbi:MAG: hypothetical protein HW421_888 [Ignavibacteria bacterium]|nr:hypothetical protein [Ignavibacteria bacterium]
MKRTTITILLALFYNFILIGISSAAVYPALPRIFIQTTYDPPEGGQIFSVNTSAEFRAALTAANPGDIIELKAGAIFTGTFTLPNKTSGAGWIYIRSSAYSSLPEPCTRVKATDAVYMPKIVASAGSGGTINTASNAHHYRFIGIEFKPVDNNYLYNVIYIGNGEKTESSLPNNIVFDRCYIHGDSVAGSRRGILMNGNYISVIDSYISDCKEDGADSQALAAYSATGPMKIVNNYLEGAGENVMFGGSDPSIPNAVPSDIEIRCNHFFKPLKWMNQLWDIKNLLEFKNAQRVLVEGNRFENNWPNAQSGFALLLTPRNQNNTAPWSVVQDITIRLNTFVNIAQGINMSGYDAPNKSQRTSRILIQNNLLNVTNLGTGGDGRMFQVLNGPTDVIFDHNTGFCTNTYMVWDGSPKADNFVFQNNLVSYAKNGFVGSGTANAITTLAMYSNPNWVITKNAVIGGSATGYPPGNYFPANTTVVGFVNYSGSDYHLNSSSPYKGLGTEGKDLGADIDSIAIAGTYKCDEQNSITELNAEIDVILSPVPADTYLCLQTGSSNDTPAQISIYDLFGNDAGLKKHYSKDEVIDISSLSNGIYMIIIRLNNECTARKFIVQH